MRLIKKTEPVLIKFTSREFAQSFRNGIIYMNPISYFRNVEESDNGGKKDLFEAPYAMISRSDLDSMMPQIGIQLSEEIKNAMLGGMFLLDEQVSNYNIFSMYKLNCDFQTGDLEPIDKKIAEFGEMFVLITNFIEFKKRIVNKISKNSSLLFFGGSEVEYYDVYGMTQMLNIFKKTNGYRYQNEYRLIAELEDYKEKPFILNIGDISDITVLGYTEKLINRIQFDEKKRLVIPVESKLEIDFDTSK